MIKVAGRVLHLAMPQELICHLHLLPQLQVLHIESVNFNLDCDLSPLSVLQQLHALYLEVNYEPDEDGPLFVGLSALKQLRVLHVHNGLAVHLPVSLTELALVQGEEGWSHGAVYPYSESMHTFRRWVGGWQAPLECVNWNMHLFACNPRKLQHTHKGVPCLQGVTDLRLTFSVVTHSLLSRWCIGYFTRLQKLHLDFSIIRFKFAPIWDLSSCTGLDRLTISIGNTYTMCPDLGHVTGVTAHFFDLQFQPGLGYSSSPSLNCSSWHVSRVSISCCPPSPGALPRCVTDSLIAVLGSTLGSHSNPLSRITVNGLAATAAIAAAAAFVSAGVPAMDFSAPSDSEWSSADLLEDSDSD